MIFTAEHAYGEDTEYRSDCGRYRIFHEAVGFGIVRARLVGEYGHIGEWCGAGALEKAKTEALSDSMTQAGREA